MVAGGGANAEPPTRVIPSIIFGPGGAGEVTCQAFTADE